MATFEEQVNDHVDKTQKKILNVARDAISETIEMAQTPVAKGGKMRVDTGFLRASGVASLDQIPSGPSTGRDRKVKESGILPEYNMTGNVLNGESLNIALAKLKIGQTFFFGWTAKYARIRETYDGFLETALQKWQNTVNISIKKFEK